MTNETLLFKLENRINKISSLDYANIEPAQIAETINKAQEEWVRRQLEGINQTKTGAEGSIRRIDDLQYILTTWTGNFTDKGIYWQSDSFPDDYIEWCRISVNATDNCKECCDRRLVVFMGNEADAEMYLADANRKPSFEWKTTFCTIMSKTFKIWTNKSFGIADPVVTYYRAPQRIVFAGSVDPYTGLNSVVNIECEFPDNITELIINDAAAILSGDMDNWQQEKRLTNDSERNN